MTKKVNILVVEDKQGTVALWKNHFAYSFKDVSAKYAKSYDDVHRLVLEEQFIPDVAIIDHRLKDSEILPGASGLEVADFLQKSISKEVHMIAASAYVDEYSQRGDSLHEAYKRFGVRIVRKGSDVVEILEEHLSNRIKEIQSPSPLYEKVVSNSKSMRAFLDNIKPYVDREVPLLLHGGPGTGKRYIAEIIHDLNHASKTKKVDLREVNCSASTMEKLEEELLGGKQGTILVTEIERLPISLQIKLTQVLRKGKIPTGIKTGTRFIATSCYVLTDAIDKEAFRQDLYSSFKVFDVPALNERRADIIPLAETHLAATHDGYTLDDELKKMLRSATWPNNIAGLFNILDQAVIESKGIKQLTPDLLDGLVAGQECLGKQTEESPSMPDAPRHTIKFCDTKRLVKLDNRDSIHIRSPKQYAVLWAIIEANNPESKHSAQTHDIFELACDKEEEIWRDGIDKGNHFIKSEPSEMNKYLRQIRNHIEKASPWLDFLEQVLPESGTREVDLSDYTIIPDCHLSGGKQISKYR